MRKSKFSIFLLLFCFKILINTNLANGDKIPLAVIFEQESNEIQSAFKYAMMAHNMNDRTHELLAYADIINTADAFKLSRIVCNQFALGVYSMIGAMSPDSFLTFHSYSNTFQMPLIIPWFPPTMDRPDEIDYATRVKPDLDDAIIDTINQYGWKEVIYIYQNHEGLLRLQGLFQRLKYSNDSLRITAVKSIGSVKEAISILRNLETSDRWKPKYIILDCPTSLTKDIIITHVRDIFMGRRTYHYLLPGLAFDEEWESSVVEFGAVNITGFRMVNPEKVLVQKFMKNWSKLNATAFLGISGRNSISSYAALMYDGVSILKETFNLILNENKNALKRNNSRRFSCGNSDYSEDQVAYFEHGNLILKNLRKVKIQGLTGNIEFTPDGKRTNYAVDVIELDANSNKNKIGEWSDKRKFRTMEKIQRDKLDKVFEINKAFENPNKTYIVTSILEEPYLFLKKAEKGEVLVGNDRYEGFCKDLAQEIADDLGIKYEIRLVKDKAYGAENPAAIGGWDGMVGELIRQEADMSVSPLTITRSSSKKAREYCPLYIPKLCLVLYCLYFPASYFYKSTEADIAIAALTITSERERVIDFSKPFMSLGISIMAYKPKKHNPGVFGFMSPLSNMIWVCVVFAYISVSLVLYIVTRYNPSEWILIHPKPGSGRDKNIGGLVQNQFSIPNSLWFSFAAIVQQGADSSPRSLAGRLVSCVWWFFCLILISSYTANFAAVRTVNRMILPIKSADELSRQSEVKYGTLMGGSTWEFFRRSEMDVYKRMWEFMNSEEGKDSQVKSYADGIKLVREKKGKYALLVESPKNDYTNQRKPCDTMKIGQNLDAKGFGVSTPLGSPLKQRINIKVLKMKETGVLSKLEKKWWDERSECDNSNKQETTASDDELSLGSLAGIFYILIIGLVLAMAVSLFEFCYNSKKEANSSQMSLKEAMKAKARVTITGPSSSSIVETQCNNSHMHPH